MVEVQVRKKPCKSIRTSIIEGAYTAENCDSGSGTVTKFIGSDISPCKVTHCRGSVLGDSPQD